VSGGPRVLYHALGGGLGHLVRAGRFLHTPGLADDALVLSASEHAGDAWLSAGVAVRCVPPALAHDLPALRTWLAQAIAEFAPHVVCVDSFPAGLLGEMAGLAESPALKGVALWHVARLLRWNAYAPLLAGAPRYSLAWRLEPLQPPHEHWLREHADAVRDCRMAPPAAAPQGLADGRPFWLVAHSGPAQEVRELIALAREQRRIENANVALAVASFDPPRRRWRAGMPRRSASSVRRASTSSPKPRPGATSASCCRSRAATTTSSSARGEADWLDREILAAGFPSARKL
jgi:hypothetical protein